ncbi:CLIP domain-containing serine protease 14D [Papilio machaon]|uniref:CLIP domain-containing serine protease 14D n=1 Tax=Papilio machaon TaxID=76193 RepID=UPI001E664794|nr:CLIP domain-containing serine protease 14D [Papilio machaon]
MCNECWKEFKGWLRSFTRTECALVALQLLLLVLFIAFLTFLILHLLACSAAEPFYVIEATKTPHEPFKTSSQTNSTLPTISISSTNHTTLSPDIECTWRPSMKTDSAVHYYDNGQVSSSVVTNNRAMPTWTPEPADGDLTDDVDKVYLLALGKVNIPQDIVFGCVLTIISEYCTLTAASCIESIEEVDSVDTFVIIERYGDGHIGQMHTVSDVLIHPEYQGINKRYDVAVLKSEDSLIKYGHVAVTLPSMLDALMITIGVEFNLLGYESHRGRASGEAGRRAVRVLAVRTLAGAQCSSGWSPRHLAHGAAVGAGGCGAAPLCAGPARAPPACSHCAGAPLLRGSRLVGVLAAGPCGEACGPALYVNVATVLDWLNSTICS